MGGGRRATLNAASSSKDSNGRGVEDVEATGGLPPLPLESLCPLLDDEGPAASSSSSSRVRLGGWATLRRMMLGISACAACVVVLGLLAMYKSETGTQTSDRVVQNAPVSMMEPADMASELRYPETCVEV